MRRLSVSSVNTTRHKHRYELREIYLYRSQYLKYLGQHIFWFTQRFWVTNA